MCVWMEGTVASVHCVCTPPHNEHSLADQELYSCMGSPATATGHVTNTNHRLSLISHTTVSKSWNMSNSYHGSCLQPHMLAHNNYLECLRSRHHPDTGTSLPLSISAVYYHTYSDVVGKSLLVARVTLAALYRAWNIYR